MEWLRGLFASQSFALTLKLITATAAVYFGVRGLGKDVRDRRGKLLRPGRIALIGIIVTGCLAVLAGVAEYNATKDKDRKDAATNEMLKRGQQRTSYPARGIALSFYAPLDRDFPGLSSYKVSLRRQIGNRRCPMNTPDFACLGPSPDAYNIPRSSRLFPSAGSPVYEFVANLTVRFTFLADAPTPGENGTMIHHYSRNGSEDIDWHNRVVNGMSLDYSRDSNSLAFRVADFKRGAPEDYGLGINSLVDIVPGVIAVAETMSGDIEVCRSMNIPTERCDSTLVALNKGMHFESLDLRIGGLKRISVDSHTVPTRCPSDFFSYVISPINGDLDKVNFFYQDPRVKPDIDVAQACRILSGQ
jgi:hypothetical protein